MGLTNEDYQKLDLDGLENAINEVVFNGKVLTDKEQRELFCNTYYTTITYYIMMRSVIYDEVLFIQRLRIQLKDLVYYGTAISDTDRNSLLLSTYSKALEYYNQVVTFNRSARTALGGSTSGVAIGGTTPKGLKQFVVSFRGYYLNQ